MKVQNITDIEGFFKAIDGCKGKVELVYSITSFSVCQDFFKSFLKKFLTFSQPEHFSSSCSLALSTDDLIIIHSITPFVNTFFHFF